jgi:hypothetical protein
MSTVYTPRSTSLSFLLSLSLLLLLYLCLLCSPSSSLSYVSIFVFLPSIVFLPLCPLCRSFFPLIFGSYRRLLILFPLFPCLYFVSFYFASLSFLLTPSPSTVFHKTSILSLSLSVSPTYLSFFLVFAIPSLCIPLCT